MIVKENSFPYIVAYGVSKDQIGQFYVEIEKHLFSVSRESDFSLLSTLINSFLLQMPYDWTFLQVFDFYFKAHKIFDLKFEPAIENAMVFLQWYIYKFDDGQKKPNQQMKELIHTLKAEIDNEATNSMAQNFDSRLSLGE